MSKIKETDDNQNLIDELKDSERECIRCEGIVEDLKEKLKAAKEDLDAAINHERFLVKGQLEEFPLLEQNEE